MIDPELGYEQIHIQEMFEQSYKKPSYDNDHQIEKFATVLSHTLVRAVALENGASIYVQNPIDLAEGSSTEVRSENGKLWVYSEGIGWRDQKPSIRVYENMDGYENLVSYLKRQVKEILDQINYQKQYHQKNGEFDFDMKSTEIHVRSECDIENIFWKNMDAWQFD